MSAQELSAVEQATVDRFGIFDDPETCSFCGEPDDGVSIGSDGTTRACPSCIAWAD